MSARHPTPPADGLLECILVTKLFSDSEFSFFQIKCVVVGFDKYYNYNKMLKATAYLGKKDCLFIATNTDAFLPMGSGRNLPGIQFKCNKYPLLNVLET